MKDTFSFFPFHTLSRSRVLVSPGGVWEVTLLLCCFNLQLSTVTSTVIIGDNGDARVARGLVNSAARCRFPLESLCFTHCSAGCDCAGL